MVDRFSVRNEVVEPRMMMSLDDLVRHCKMHGIPMDAILIFRGIRKNPRTERNVTDVLEVHKHGDLTYMILGGHQ